MKKNIGPPDKIIRILFGIVAAGLYFTGTISGTFGAILVVAGAVLFLTALVGTCPIYLGLKLSTNKIDRTA